jgi:hypothetical protein
MIVPEITEVQRISLKPGDVVAATVPLAITQAQALEIRSGLSEAFPDNKCIVMCGGLELKVVEPE